MASFPIEYRCPPGVGVVTDRVAPDATGRILLSTREGGAIAIDTEVFDVWRRASGLGREADLRPSDAEVLACLAEAGLLERTTGDSVTASVPQPTTGRGSTRVAAVVVVSGASELRWLEDCLRSVGQQSVACADIVVVDNRSEADLPEWMMARGLRGRVIRLTRRLSLAAALNAGVGQTSADHYLLMNADVRLDPDAVLHLIAAAGPQAAAVAPKLLFWWAPAFLNGLGNRVPQHGWGTDNAIGQLDLGQWDAVTTVPSGCLAVLFVRHEAWIDVGPFDSWYPGYYEDSDWCYRARACGWSVGAAPAAVGYHVYGASWAVQDHDALPPAKLERALVGRWRFTLKIPAGRRLKHTILAVAMEDWRNILAAVRTRSWSGLWVYCRVALRLVGQAPSLWRSRRDLQRRRTVPDESLFPSEAGMPRGMQSGNLPALSMPAVRDYYGPLLRSGTCRRVPEVPEPR